MKVRCKKCHYNFDVAVPADGGVVVAVCPQCGNRMELMSAGETQPQEPIRVEAKPAKPIAAPAAEETIVATTAAANQPIKQQPVQPAPQPVQQQPVQQQPVQPAQQPTVVYDPSGSGNEGKKSNLVPILLGAIFGLLVVCAIILFMQREPKEVAAPTETTQVEETTAPAVSSVSESAPASVEAPAEEVPSVSAVKETSSQFSPQYTSSGVSSFCELPFVIESQLARTGYNVDSFQDVLRKGKVTSGNNMIMYEHSDGVRYQFFFDESPRNSTAILTGIAISRQVSSPHDACMQMDDAFEFNNYSYYGYNLYRGSSGLVFSPGYKGKRVYCYIYMPHAPNKDAAPRG